MMSTVFQRFSLLPGGSACTGLATVASKSDGSGTATEDILLYVLRLGICLGSANGKHLSNSS